MGLGLEGSGIIEAELAAVWRPEDDEQERTGGRGDQGWRREGEEEEEEGEDEEDHEKKERAKNMSNNPILKGRE